MIFTVLIGCQNGARRNPSFEDATENASLTFIQSAQTGYTYPIYIYLPESYDNGQTHYPVIFATDGDAPFPPDGRFVNLARILQRRHTDVILVGIGGTARRAKDYALPGAVKYHAFITQELIPFVDSHFRTDPKRRVLSGLSLGGSFVVTALLLEAPDTLFFSHYLSAEGAFFQPSFVAQEKRFSNTIGTKSIHATLILARGAASNKVQQNQWSDAMRTRDMLALANVAKTFGDATNSAVVDALYRRMMNRAYVDLTLIETQFDTDHGGTDNPSFEDAVIKIFK
jgi:predicted alpha/beta superfamily hydrolase